VTYGLLGRYRKCEVKDFRDAMIGSEYMQGISLQCYTIFPSRLFVVYGDMTLQFIVRMVSTVIATQIQPHFLSAAKFGRTRYSTPYLVSSLNKNYFSATCAVPGFPIITIDAPDLTSHWVVKAQYSSSTLVSNWIHSNH
jgi:hypothetical protein